MSVSSAAPLAIAQVTPYPLESGHPVTAHVLRLADELADAGHRVVVLGASHDPQRIAATRRLLRDTPQTALPDAGEAPLILAVGSAPISSAAIPGVGRVPALAVDATRTVDDVLSTLPLDLVHVHEPFGPSISTAALRHSRSLNVGTFHLPAERFIAGMGSGPAIGRKRSERLLGRLDDRLATSSTTASLVARSFPINRGYAPRVPPPAALGRKTTPLDGVVRPLPGPPTSEAPTDGPRPLHIVLPRDEERTARRTVLRAIRRLDLDLPWRVTVLVPDDDTSPFALPTMSAERRARIALASTDAVPADADIVVLASAGARPAPHVLVDVLARGAVPVASAIDIHDELTDGGVRGPLFGPADVDVLVAQLERLIGDPGTLEAHRRANRERPLTEDSWGPYLAWVIDRYRSLLARRHDPDRFDPEVVARLRGRPLIDVDLHMHTDHSHDCATPVEVLLDAARRQGLGAIAVTDHNLVSGAHEAAAKAAEYGVKVIVGEEVKTADQGEVIGLFIEEQIPKGVTLQEAIAEIRRQGGLVYVPHPFDRMHSVPDYEHMLDIVDEIDAVEIFNPRIAIGSYNEEAARFAHKYRMVAGAGSDSHVAQGLGSVRLRMPDFDGPEEFLASLAQAEITTKLGTLAYVQALKFWETKATPAPARRIVRERRVRRATRD